MKNEIKDNGSLYQRYKNALGNGSIVAEVATALACMTIGLGTIGGMIAFCYGQEYAGRKVKEYAQRREIAGAKGATIDEKMHSAYLDERKAEIESKDETKRIQREREVLDYIRQLQTTGVIGKALRQSGYDVSGSICVKDDRGLVYCIEYDSLDKRIKDQSTVRTGKLSDVRIVGTNQGVVNVKARAHNVELADKVDGLYAGGGKNDN